RDARAERSGGVTARAVSFSFRCVAVGGSGAPAATKATLATKRNEKTKRIRHPDPIFAVKSRIQRGSGPRFAHGASRPVVAAPTRAGHRFATIGSFLPRFGLWQRPIGAV